MLVHGDCETDAGGSALWRVKEWAQAENFARCYFPEGSPGRNPGEQF